MYVFEYDLLNRMTRLNYPGDTFESYSYDEIGNLKTYTNRAGDVRTFTYDNRNRQTLSDWNNQTPDVTSKFDLAGRLLFRSSH
jgi:YD repeat-containing protein